MNNREKNFTRNFLRGSAARRTTTIRTTPASSTSPKAVTRTTKLPRRKYLTRISTTTKKSLESQETTTSKPTSIRYEFSSRRPPFLRRTAATPTYEKLKIAENDSIGRPLELRDVVVALKDIQSAPPPIKTTTTRNPPAEETTKINVNEITFTTSRPLNRFRIKASTTTSSPTIHSSIKAHSSPHQPAHTIAYTTPFDNIFKSTLTNPYYEYNIQDNPGVGYEASHSDLLDRLPEHSKVLVHSNGVIECLDQGSFPHPIFCKKFISCAKMENGKMIGWEYTCPKNLSFDPIGGMCNWSADLGCDEL